MDCCPSVLSIREPSGDCPPLIDTNPPSRIPKRRKTSHPKGCLAFFRPLRLSQSRSSGFAFLRKSHGGCDSPPDCRQEPPFESTFPNTETQKRETPNGVSRSFAPSDCLNPGTVDSLFCGKATAVATVHRTVAKSRLSNPPSQIPKRRKTSHPKGCLVFLVGEGGFEPPKAVPADLQSVPFGHSGIPPYSSPFKPPYRSLGFGAGRRTRTPDLLITNQLLYQLSYTSTARTSKVIIAALPPFVKKYFFVFAEFFFAGPECACIPPRRVV